EESAGRFRAASPITGSVATASVLLETRLSKGKIPQTSDPLLRALLDSGRPRIHTVDRLQTHSLDATRAELGAVGLAGHNLHAAPRPRFDIRPAPGVPLATPGGAAGGREEVLGGARGRGGGQVPGLASLSAHH